MEKKQKKSFKKYKIELFLFENTTFPINGFIIYIEKKKHNLEREYNLAYLPKTKL